MSTFKQVVNKLEEIISTNVLYNDFGSGNQKWMDRKDITNRHSFILDDYSSLWTTIRSALESGFDYVEIILMEEE